MGRDTIGLSRFDEVSGAWTFEGRIWLLESGSDPVTNRIRFRKDSLNQR